MKKTIVIAMLLVMAVMAFAATSPFDDPRLLQFYSEPNIAKVPWGPEVTRTNTFDGTTITDQLWTDTRTPYVRLCYSKKEGLIWSEVDFYKNTYTRQQFIEFIKKFSMGHDANWEPPTKTLSNGTVRSGLLPVVGGDIPHAVTLYYRTDRTLYIRYFPNY